MKNFRLAYYFLFAYIIRSSAEEYSAVKNSAVENSAVESAYVKKIFFVCFSEKNLI